MNNTVFHEIAWLLLGAAAVGLLGTALRQPVIVSFIAVGIAAAAFFDSSPETASQIRFLAELGVALLLFLVGLKLDWRLVKRLGPVALATGLGQVVFTAGIGFPIGLALGLDWLTSLYVAVALTFSSTIIVVKLLSDKRELETLHGRIALGFLIVQDIVVVIAMVVLSTVGIGVTQRGGLTDLGAIIGSLLAVVVILVLFVRYLADPLMARLARTPELLVIASIGWAAAAAAVGDMIGLGKELGGLAAGVSIGSTPYRDLVSARLSALRDFLLLFFFLSIGATLDLSTLGKDVTPAIVFSLFVLIGNPLIVLFIMASMGYRTRTGFLAGLTVAQISEFSLIFMAMGLSLGHVDQSAVGLVTLVGLVTIALSVYMITYSQQLYAWCQPLLRPFDFGAWREAAAANDEDKATIDVIIFGLGRFGSQLLRRLEDAGYNVLGVDLDPQAIRRFSREGYQVRYGDVTEQDFWGELPLTQARWIVLSVPYGTILLTETDPRSGLLTAIRTHRFGGRVAITARTDQEARRLQEGGGVDLVLYPFDDAATSAAKQITDLDEESITQEAAGALAPASLVPPVSEDQPRVIIVGCGRVGDLVSEMLARHDVRYVALDSDSALVARERRRGKPIFYGDATDPELLRRFGIASAHALVVTMDNPTAVESVITAARTERPDLIIVARARDAEHATKLYELNVTDAVPETIEASLQLSEALLVNMGVPMGLVIASIHEKRDELRHALQGSEREGRVRRAIRASTRRKSDGGT
ncbi:cation:proton antiporter [Pseudorhodoplanes sinuspersici]|uniref:Sodium:proton exchanger n=1 Tax=Pseudorhodoplanes sinuspersici TaxID=1235591 RepID=A0A1W6ZPC5_9HYPH|nr:cation:proton antiporter [Pseudorhodoplanes sinuspersici]ARP99221.1 sodium:proton exchanger [Pseudorhodoplanes sinuspersici]RKE69113.1 transporter (CPA2 family) [Pseudorhodoplanes sinuspersici]